MRTGARFSLRPEERWPSLSAVEYAGRAAESASRPQKILCGEDRILYCVKFSNNTHGNGRALVAECIAGILGARLNAPVAQVALIEVGAQFLELNPIELQPGLSATAGFASRFEM